MNKEFIPYEQALKFKELGFDEPCLGAYGAWGFMSSNDVNSLSDEVTQEDLDNQGYNEEDGVCLAPLYQQIFRWFREKHNFYISVNRTHDNNWVIDLYLLGVHKPKSTIFGETYEEAETACLERLIEIVKENKK